MNARRCLCTRLVRAWSDHRIQCLPARLTPISRDIAGASACLAQAEHRLNMIPVVRRWFAAHKTNDHRYRIRPGTCLVRGSDRMNDGRRASAVPITRYRRRFGRSSTGPSRASIRNNAAFSSLIPRVYIQYSPMLKQAWHEPRASAEHRMNAHRDLAVRVSGEMMISPMLYRVGIGLSPTSSRDNAVCLPVIPGAYIQCSLCLKQAWHEPRPSIGWNGCRASAVRMLGYCRRLARSKIGWNFYRVFAVPYTKCRPILPWAWPRLRLSISAGTGRPFPVILPDNGQSRLGRASAVYSAVTLCRYPTLIQAWDVH